MILGQNVEHEVTTCLEGRAGKFIFFRPPADNVSLLHT